jgi:hypothetical protein
MGIEYHVLCHFNRFAFQATMLIMILCTWNHYFTHPLFHVLHLLLVFRVYRVVDVVAVQWTRVRDDEAQAVAAVIAGILGVGWSNHIISYHTRCTLFRPPTSAF